MSSGEGWVALGQSWLWKCPRLGRELMLDSSLFSLNLSLPSPQEYDSSDPGLVAREQHLRIFRKLLLPPQEVQKAAEFFRQCWGVGAGLWRGASGGVQAPSAW